MDCVRNGVSFAGDYTDGGGSMEADGHWGGNRLDLLVTARFIIGHCHVGAFALPWHTEEWVMCPWCGDDFTREHLLWECRGLSQERRVFLCGIKSREFESLEQCVLFYGSRIGRVLRAVGGLLASMGAVQ